MPLNTSYFNAEQALEHFGEQNIMIDSLHFLLEDALDEDTRQIAIARDQVNRHSLKALAHKMKSTALYAAAKPLEQACSALEANASTWSDTELIAAAQDILDITAHTRDAIASWLKQQ